MSQKSGNNIGLAQGYSPINLIVGHSYAGGSSGIHNFPLTISVTGFPLANTEPIIRIYDNGTNTLLAEARFNYGDDISSAVPLFDNNFVANFQPYFQVGSQVQDGDTLAFAKKPWAIATNNTNTPYDNGAIELRLELALNIGGSDDDLAGLNTESANLRNFYMTPISADLALMVRYEFPDIRVVDLNTGDTLLTSIAGYNFEGLSTDTTRSVNGAPVVIAKVNAIATGDEYIAELTFNGTDDWTLTLVSDPLTFLDVVQIDVDTYVGREVNSRKVIFGQRAAAGTSNVICYAWDGVSKYTESGLGSTGSSERGWSTQIDSISGDMYLAMHWTSGTQPPRIRRLFWNGGDVTLAASWSTNNTIASGPGDILTAGKLFQDSTKMAREGKMRIIGYDGTIGLTGGSIPMFYVFGGNTQAAANDLAKEEWDGVSAWTRTVLGAGWGNNAATKTDGMMSNPYSGKIYTSTTKTNFRLMEIDPFTEITRTVQIFGTAAEFITF